MKIFILLCTVLSFVGVQQCDAAPFAVQKAKVLENIISRIGTIEKGIADARQGKGYFHGRMGDLKMPLKDWEVKINSFATEYPKDPERQLLAIAAWLRDWTVDDIKIEYEID
jgi:hypothetical protein